MIATQHSCHLQTCKMTCVIPVCPISVTVRMQGPIVCPGDMDLDPVTGQYRLSASVPAVEVNDLRKTLGIRPPPFAVGGALRGVLHCTGPLEQPVFSGASAVALQSRFFQALLQSRPDSCAMLPIDDQDSPFPTHA